MRFEEIDTYKKLYKQMSINKRHFNSVKYDDLNTLTAQTSKNNFSFVNIINTTLFILTRNKVDNTFRYKIKPK